jgi:hypothetical protein
MSEPHLITDSPGSETTTGEPKNLDDTVNPQLIEKEHGSTQKLILLWLLICFSASLVASYIMVFAAAIVPAIDQNIIKDSLPLLLIPQFTLLGVALGFHFGQAK